MPVPAAGPGKSEHPIRCGGTMQLQMPALMQRLFTYACAAQAFCIASFFLNCLECPAFSGRLSTSLLPACPSYALFQQRPAAGRDQACRTALHCTSTKY